MNQEFLKSIEKVHFVGIGGIGISALARLMVNKGKKVTGTNDGESPNTLDGLRGMGVSVYLDRNIEHIDSDTDLIVYSTAWEQNECDFMNAVRGTGIPILTYPEALGMVSRGMRTIAVSGTHGKTTTTAMIAEILVGARLNPTVIVGSLLKSGTNFIGGSSDIFVVEACEYKRSFLNLSPEILVITNIDNDHLDYYGSIEGVQKAFAELVKKVPATGVIVCNPHDPLLAPAIRGAVAKVVDYTQDLGSETPSLAVPGEHNIRNAKAAITVARLLGVAEEEALQLVAKFQGTWRRQEFKGSTEQDALVYDDYAHHPTEIKATLQGFRSKYLQSNIRVVFQPHLYSRTKLLLGEFAQSFGDANEVILLPIYAARETLDPEITSEILADAIRAHNSNVRVENNIGEIVSYLSETLTSNDIIITMGAGDVLKVGEQLTESKKVLQ